VWRMGYGFMPIYLALTVAAEMYPLLKEVGRKEAATRKRGSLLKSVALGLVLGALGVHLLVLSFWQRSMLSVALILNLIWALLIQQKDEGAATARHLLLVAGAIGVTLLLALFPLVPTIGNERSPFFT
jgi:hypothetical protein